MQKNAVVQDEEHEFTGITIKVISVSNVKTQIDGGEVFVGVKCHDKFAQTLKKPNDRDNILFQQYFFYNTTQILDDDIVFELYQTHYDHGSSKILLSSNKMDRSKSMNVQGIFLGASKPIQISRLARKNHQKSYDLLSEQNKVVGKINVGFDYLQRQDIVGGIKCPNLSLRPDKNIKSPLTLQNKYAQYKNFYSFLDGNQTPNCEFFPKKFLH